MVQTRPHDRTIEDIREDHRKRMSAIEAIEQSGFDHRIQGVERALNNIGLKLNEPQKLNLIDLLNARSVNAINTQKYALINTFVLKKDEAWKLDQISKILDIAIRS